MKLLSRLFGKSPQIFDDHGNVVHQLPEERWQAWRARFDKSSHYDWHKHHGTTRQPTTPQTITKKP